MVEDFKANHKTDVAATYACKGSDVVIEASGTLELKGAGGSIVIAAGGIYIQGSMVYINSGAGPSVAPVSATAAAPQLVDDPSAADSSQPGKDVVYTGAAAAIVSTPAQAEVPGHEFTEETPPANATHTIDIQLVDEVGNPIAGERYEITTPDGKIRRGTTDANGRAHEGGLLPGQCQIAFPRLDSDAWERDV